jgi:hypothetical protein
LVGYLEGNCIDKESERFNERKCGRLTLVRAVEIATVQVLGSKLTIIGIQKVGCKNEGERHEIRLA